MNTNTLSLHADAWLQARSNTMTNMSTVEVFCMTQATHQSSCAQCQISDHLPSGSFKQLAYFAYMLLVVNSIGETGQPFHMTVNSHQFDITHRRTDESSVSVSEHFYSGPHTLADMPLMVIDGTHSQASCLRRIRESRWIRALGNESQGQ